MSLNKKNQQMLIDLAYQSIQAGFDSGTPYSVDLRSYPTELLQQTATFVVLEKNDQLRGSEGMVEAVFPLAEDICENAYSAAFNDARFPKLEQVELSEIKIKLHILSPLEEMFFMSEEDLITQIKPNIDGLVLESGSRKGNFLPAVWKTIRTPEQFLQHLKQKAGLAKNFWSENIRVYRYTADMIC